MEKHAKTTRFCLICNYVSRIIEPITSRCAKFRFKPLADDVLRSRLRHIATAENVNIDDEVNRTFFFSHHVIHCSTCCVQTIEALLAASEGDMRKAITFLQSCARLHKKDDAALTQQDVREIAGVIPDDVIVSLVDVCRTNSYEKVQRFVDVS